MYAPDTFHSLYTEEFFRHNEQRIAKFSGEKSSREFHCKSWKFGMGLSGVGELELWGGRMLCLLVVM